jgi:hypothetical protein
MLNLLIQAYLGKASSCGLVVKADSSQSRGHGFEPQHRMDVSNASYYINMKIKKIKVAKWGTQKKIFKKDLFWDLVNYITLTNGSQPEVHVTLGVCEKLTGGMQNFEKEAHLD